MNMPQTDWLSRRKDGGFDVDPDIIYKKLFDEIKAVIKKSDKAYDIILDQYWGEIIYQCAKLEVLRIIGYTELDPRRKDPPMPIQIHIRADGGRKERWALKRLAKGRGILAATKGHEARQVYIALRGYLPG